MGGTLHDGDIGNRSPVYNGRYALFERPVILLESIARRQQVLDVHRLLICVHRDLVIAAALQPGRADRGHVPVSELQAANAARVCSDGDLRLRFACDTALIVVAQSHAADRVAAPVGQVQLAVLPNENGRVLIQETAGAGDLQCAGRSVAYIELPYRKFGAVDRMILQIQRKGFRGLAGDVDVLVKRDIRQQSKGRAVRGVIHRGG